MDTLEYYDVVDQQRIIIHTMMSKKTSTHMLGSSHSLRPYVYIFKPVHIQIRCQLDDILDCVDMRFAPNVNVI